MPSGSGLDAQLMAKFESVYGTAVTVDRAFEVDSESMAWAPTWREPSGLRPGRRFKRAAKLAQTRFGAAGSIPMQFATRDMGFWLKLALASSVSTPTLISGTAYKQIHQPGGSVFPPSATIQVGKPEPESGTVQPHTYVGCVATGFEMSTTDGETLNLSVDVDARDELTATALAAASIPTSAEVFDFSDATVFKLGGTASTTSGVVSIAGGTAVSAVVNEWSLSGDNTLALERFGLGNAGYKRGPRYNGFAGYTGSMTVEYLRSEWYTPFKANTTLPMQLSFIGSQIGATGSFNTVDVVMPGMKIKAASPQVGGPDLVMQSIDYELYDDDVNAPLQITLISADSAAL